MQLGVAIALALDLLDRRQHVVAVVAGTAVALAHEMQLALGRQAAGILAVAAVDHVTERGHAALRVVVEPDRPPGLAIDARDLLARAQVIDGGGPFGRRDAIGDAAAIAAAVETEHQAGLFRRAAMHEGIDAKRAVRADQPRVPPLQEVEAGPPHQRAIAEHPEVLAAVLDRAFHGGWRVTGARFGRNLQGGGRVRRSGAETPHSPCD